MKVWYAYHVRISLRLSIRHLASASKSLAVFLWNSLEQSFSSPVNITKIDSVKTTYFFREDKNFISYQIWIKLFNRYLHVMLLIRREFRENIHREGGVFFMVVNEIILTRVPWNRMKFWEGRTLWTSLISPFAVLLSTIYANLFLRKFVKEKKTLL